MKRLILAALLLIIPAVAYSHPGKTDRYGGHKCLKDCEEWKLYYAEYHLHDKDMRPIRVNKPRKRAPEPQVQTAVTATNEPAPIISVKTETVTIYRTIATVPEQNNLPNPLLYVLLILLLLLLILRRTRRNEEEKRK